VAVEIRTAAELIGLDVEGNGAARRAARETPLFRSVLQAFVDWTGPIPVEAILSAFQPPACERAREALTRLNDEDLLRIEAGRIGLAYPFSASPTPFVVDLDEDHGQRFACCAIDALGIAPMLGRAVRIWSCCHHCAAPMELSVDPSGVEPNAQGVTVWVGRRAEGGRRACDGL
jgi:hypothetical protein